MPECQSLCCLFLGVSVFCALFCLSVRLCRAYNVCALFQRVNEEVLQLFTSPAADNIGRAMQLIHQLIIPSLAKLEDSSLQSDHAVKAEVTEAWCTLLSGDNLGGLQSHDNWQVCIFN